jgi:hypothetical protein
MITWWLWCSAICWLIVGPLWVLVKMLERGSPAPRPKCGHR